MKLLNLINLWVASEFVHCQQTAKTCEKPVLRKEIRELSLGEVRNLTDAMLKLRTLTDTNKNWDALVRMHMVAEDVAHGVPLFLPWHRYFLKLFEKMLQTINPTVSLPYWNWSLDSQAPENSIVFTDSYFGGNGGWDNCIDKGPFAWTYSNYPDTHCIRRDFNGGNKLSALYSPEALEVILSTSSNYNEFRIKIEGPPHAAVHDNIGGQRGDIRNMWSPNDPIFWLHHAFIDMLWWNWQKRMGSMGSNYGGPGNSTYTQKISPWPIEVYKVLNTTSNPDLCYYYANLNIELPKVMPSVNPNKRISASMRSKKTVTQTSLVANIKKVKMERMTIKGLDDLMKQIANGEVETEKVDPFDRKKKNKIRSPQKLSPETIKMFKLDPETVNEQENVWDLVGQAFNTVDDYQVQSDLKN